EDDTVDVGDVIVRVGTPGSAPAAKEEPAEEPKAEAPKAEAADSTDVVMPELGESVTEGTITQWLKSV
ncbi:hypothetical protein NG01_11660, partial [Corynebacterium diphtheriae]